MATYCLQIVITTQHFLTFPEHIEHQVVNLRILYWKNSYIAYVIRWLDGCLYLHFSILSHKLWLETTYPACNNVIEPDRHSRLQIATEITVKHSRKLSLQVRGLSQNEDNGSWNIPLSSRSSFGFDSWLFLSRVIF